MLTLAHQIGLGLAHHPEQAGVMPHLRRLHPTGVVHLSHVARLVAMVVEQGFASVRDADDVRDGAIPQPRHGAGLDQALSLE